MPGPRGPEDEPGGAPFDPYERAAERRAAEARADRAAGRSGSGYDDEHDPTSVARAPDALLAKPPRNIARKILLGLVLLSFLLALGSSRRPRPPEVAPDCVKASFTLSATTVEQNKPVAFTIVGPEGREYALGLDTTTFERQPDGTWRGVPRAGYERMFLVPAEPARMPQGCSRPGVFATPVDLGTHTVTLYELTERGAVFVQQQDLAVTERS